MGSAEPREPALRDKVLTVPPGFVPEAELARSQKFGPGSRAGLDVKEFAASLGIRFPDGAFVRYFPDAHALLVRNTAENLDLVDTLFESCGPEFFSNLAIEFVALDCQLPELAPDRLPRIRDILALSPADRRVVSRLFVIAKSGIGAASARTDASRQGDLPARQTAPSDPPKTTIPPASDAIAVTASVESVIGPDGQAVDVDYHYTLRRPSREGLSSEIALTGSISTRGELPLVIHASRSDPAGRTVVVAARVLLRDSRGQKFPPW